MKERVAYLKLWQGIAIVTDISLAGWFVSAADTAERLRIFLALLAIVLLSLGIVVLHRQIERRVKEIDKL